MQQTSSYPDSSALDKQVRAAAAAGANILEPPGFAIPPAANAEIVKNLQEAGSEVIRTGKAYFHEEARQAAYEQVLNAIFVCIADQQNYLKGGPVPDKTAPPTQ
jgi:hypothetical protein